ncbi:hypothetical protein R3P38DRAFT_2924846, partial [Favolaschia claudopus]
MAVGNRLVHIQFVLKNEVYAYDIKATCYAFSPLSMDTALDLSALETVDAIPVALLLSCRSVYQEEFAILYRQNIFCLSLWDLVPIVGCAWGTYVLPKIRRIYLHQILCPPSNYDFDMFLNMHLDSLTVQFNTHDEVQLDTMKWPEYRVAYLLTDASAQALLTVPHSRNLRIIFRTD